MAAAMDRSPQRSAPLKSSGLRRPVSVQGGGCRVTVDPDGGVREHYSLAERRALFGAGQVWFYKIQAGIVVQAQRPDWGVRVSPSGVVFTGRIFDGADVVQSLELYGGGMSGYVRRMKLSNAGRQPLRLRVLAVNDPTAAQFGDRGWGSLGVNAFSRGSHVALDEVSSPPAARVIGASPPPGMFYLTSSRSRALDAVSAGDLPEGTAGMSGQVLVLSSHEFELGPGDGTEVVYTSLYTPGKLEDALAEFGKPGSAARPTRVPLRILTSDDAVTEAAAWAVPAAGAGGYSQDRLDRYESLRALCYVDPPGAKMVIEGAKHEVRRDGSLPHSLDPARPGVLETAVFLGGASAYLTMLPDKKQRKALYPAVKKAASYLLAISKDATVFTDPSLPQGWRRGVGKGYPAGEIPEVSLAVAAGLDGAALAAKAVSKGDDAAKFRERSEMIAERVRRKLVDERGFLCLSKDGPDATRWDETVDMATAAYRRSFSGSSEQGGIHRLTEKDFDTPYGPRCVPTTNQVYFNSSYGNGQLGGVWTRASLAHAISCYRAGVPGLGGMSLGKVARLVTDGASKLGGAPGEFPLWVDPEAKAAHGEFSDPVAAARFIEALLEGEVGLSTSAEGVTVAPPATSPYGWVLASGGEGNGARCAFVGRGGGGAHAFTAGTWGRSDGHFAKWEPLPAPRSVVAASFSSPGQVLILGNSGSAPARFTVSFTPRGAGLSQKLSTPLEELDQGTGEWRKAATLRVFSTMSFDASLGAGGWKAFRVSTA